MEIFSPTIFSPWSVESAYGTLGYGGLSAFGLGRWK